MSIIGSNILAGAAGSGVSAYEIEQSLRFDGSQYLSWTPSSAGNRKKWTWSGWFKRTTLGHFGGGGDYMPFGIAASTGSGTYDVPFYLAYNTQNDQPFWHLGTAGNYETKASMKLRDVSAWYHAVCVLDTDNATASNRWRTWVNGVEITSFDQRPTVSQGYAGGFINNNINHYVGWTGTTGQQYVKGYMAEYHFVDGQALTHEDFGEYDDNGVWRPIAYTGSHGTNGFYLKFDPSATNGIGHDHSGNGNNWTANNFTTSGTGTDVMSDTPTTNWCTLNPTAKAIDSGSLPYNSLVLSNGNLDLNGEYGNVIGTIGVTEGKWYWEVQAGEGIMAGVSDKSQVTNTNPIPGSASWSRSAAWNVYYANDVLNSGYTVGSVTLSAATSSSDIIGVALDMDAGEVRYYKNGTVQNSGNAVITGVTGIAFPIFRGARSGVRSVNFGQRAFEYTPPTGYVALNTSNLPAPDIADGSKYFDTLTYTGDGLTPKEINGLEFQPDFVWIKDRSASTDHILTDAVRGATKNLVTNNTTSENTDAQNLQSFDNDGFTIGNASQVNLSSGRNYVAWNWLAGNGTSSNTDGSITSTVSANPTAGFSIVSYTGNATDGATVGHGLGVAPNMVICKSRSNAESWRVFHSSLPSGQNVYLNATNAADTITSTAGGGIGTSPSSTTFTLVTGAGGNANNVNINSATYIAYCFAEVEGYSKFGSYTGNGSSDGPFVFCGFRPRWVLTKRTDSTSVWMIYDTARLGYNQSNNYLQPNTSIAEGSGDNFIDILSNGFKVRVGSQSINVSGGTYIFAAFAEHPTGGSGISPATAR